MSKEPDGPVAADHAREDLSDMLMSFAAIRELTGTQQDSAEETIEAVRGALNSASAYFAERNSARDAWSRRVKQCEELEAKLAVFSTQPADWSVFNTGAEVAGGLTYAEALDYLTPARLERGWTAVCVVNKDNAPAIK